MFEDSPERKKEERREERQRRCRARAESNMAAKTKTHNQKESKNEEMKMGDDPKVRIASWIIKMCGYCVCCCSLQHETGSSTALQHINTHFPSHARNPNALTLPPTVGWGQSQLQSAYSLSVSEQL